METAQTAWDLQDLSDGRFILGLGTQVKAHISAASLCPGTSPCRPPQGLHTGSARHLGVLPDRGAFAFEGEFYQHTLMTPFFNPGPIEHPEIPIYIAGVNTRLASSPASSATASTSTPSTRPEYVRQTVKPAIAEGADEAGRDPGRSSSPRASSSSPRRTRRRSAQREKMRAQISFYASTPTYRTVLEAHGWEEVGERLGNHGP